MSKLMEDRLDEREYNKNIQIVVDMLTKKSYGVSAMCKLMEDRVIDAKMSEKIQIVTNLLAMGDLTHEKIALATGLTVSDIEDIAKQFEASKVQ